MKRLALALLLAACGDSTSRPEPDPTPAPEPAGTWRTRVPAVPGTPVLTWVNGPVRFGEMIRVGSSAVGVADLDPDTGEVMWQDQEAGPFAPRPGDPDVIRTVNVEGGPVTVTRMGLSRDDAWTHRFDEPADVGVAGPVLAGEVLVLTVDDALVGLDWATGARRWRAEGRWAYAAGALDAHGSAVRAISLDGGVAAALVRATDGEVRQRGEPVEGLVVLSAAWSREHARVVIAVRRDASMRRDAIVALTYSGKPLWKRELPEPDEPRTDPIGLLIERNSVYVFHDGRFAARFPL